MRESVAQRPSAERVTCQPTHERVYERVCESFVKCDPCQKTKKMPRFHPARKRRPECECGLTMSSVGRSVVVLTVKGGSEGDFFEGFFRVPNDQIAGLASSCFTSACSRTRCSHCSPQTNRTASYLFGTIHTTWTAASIALYLPSPTPFRHRMPRSAAAGGRPPGNRQWASQRRRGRARIRPSPCTQYPNTPIPQYPNTPHPTYPNTPIPQYPPSIAVQPVSRRIFCPQSAQTAARRCISVTYPALPLPLTAHPHP